MKKYLTKLQSTDAVLLGLGLVVVGFGLAITAVIVFHPSAGIPVSFKKQLESPTYIGKPQSTVQMDKKSYKYDSTNKVFSYVAQVIGTQTQLTVTEQPTPSEFVDVPQAYDKFTESIKPFLTFDSSLGKVNVGKPGQLGNQVAVVNGQGTLMFVRTSADLSEDQWHHVFNDLVRGN